jgi:hypothetical protein
MADNKNLIYTITVKDDGTYAIKELNVEVKDATELFQTLNKNMLDNAKAGKLTASAMLAQINQLKQLRNANTTNNALFRKQTEDIRLLENEYKKLTLVTQQQTDKTGLASATLVEFSRGVQDANYGFRGVANNLSQLTTLMTTLIGTTGGLRNAFIALRAAFTGPIGFLVVANIVIAALERLSMQGEKAAQSIENFDASVITSTKELRRYKDLLDDVNTSLEKRQEVTDLITATDSKFAEVIQAQLGDQEAINKLTADYVELQLNLREQEEIFNENAKVTAGNQLTQAELIKEQTRLQKILNVELEEGDISERTASDLASIDKLLAAYDKQNAAIIKRRDLLIEFNDLLKKPDTFDFSTAGFTELDEDFDAAAFQEQFLGIPEDFNIDDIPFLDAAEIAFNERAEFLKQFQIQSAADRINLAEDNAIKELDLLYQDLDNRIGYEEDLTKITEYYANERIRVGDKESEARQRSIREIGRAVSSVGKLLQDVSGENKNLAVAGVIVEKAGAIAQIVSNTAIANAKAVAAFPITAGQPFVGINTASAGISIASTIAQASQAIQEIKNPSSGSSGGSAASALPSTPIQAPAFNVVGATQTSQLAQTISQAEQQPIKAYVVASDVSTAQELERSTIEGASIG